ncbi:MAG: hypothetical protein HQ517_17925 [SAR324 cluster bacterium]|nr:hypothetical protein [SAR324 cluster bacterium]
MQSVQEIEKAITKLSVAELGGFRKWFKNFDQKNWDRQFEEDVKSGSPYSSGNWRMIELIKGR